MSDEDDFQAWLDEHPDDHTARSIFGDWLADREDERAEGYWAMAALGRYPRDYESAWWFRTEFTLDRHYYLPKDWFDCLEIRGKGWACAPDFAIRDDMTDPASRRELEDAAARAFAKLPAERRAELLQGALT